MSNNIPFYPLLRRDVDIIIALDTSADIQTTPWFERTEGSSPRLFPLGNSLTPGYAKQKGIIGWPVGVGWPKDTSPSENLETLEKALPATKEEARAKLDSSKAQPSPDEPNDPITQKYGLGHCNIWVGTAAEHKDIERPPLPKKPLQIDETWRMPTDAGIMLIYLPLLPNLKCPGVEPEQSEYMSTWNFVYTPEQVDQVVELAEQNFKEGKERIRRAVRAAWERKRWVRLEKEREERIFNRGRELVRDAVGLRRL